MSRRVPRGMLAAVAAAALLASCSDDDGGGADDGGGEQGDRARQITTVARQWQEAMNSRDWRTACKLYTPAARGGTVAACVEANDVDQDDQDDGAAPSPPEMIRGDGSTVSPLPSPSDSGPQYADTGPVRVDRPVKVPGHGDHPAGYGVMATYSVKWPDKEASTSRRAVRLVDAGGTWAVDQFEDIAPTDVEHGDPVRDALSRPASGG